MPSLYDQITALNVQQMTGALDPWVDDVLRRRAIKDRDRQTAITQANRVALVREDARIHGENALKLAEINRKAIAEEGNANRLATEKNERLRLAAGIANNAARDAKAFKLLDEKEKRDALEKAVEKAQPYGRIKIDKSKTIDEQYDSVQQQSSDLFEQAAVNAGSKLETLKSRVSDVENKIAHARLADETALSLLAQQEAEKTFSNSLTGMMHGGPTDSELVAIRNQPGVNLSAKISAAIKARKIDPSRGAEIQSNLSAYAAEQNAKLANERNRPTRDILIELGKEKDRAIKAHDTFNLEPKNQPLLFRASMNSAPVTVPTGTAAAAAPSNPYAELDRTLRPQGATGFGNLRAAERDIPEQAAPPPYVAPPPSSGLPVTLDAGTGEVESSSILNGLPPELAGRILSSIQGQEAAALVRNATPNAIRSMVQQAVAPHLAERESAVKSLSILKELYRSGKISSETYRAESSKLENERDSAQDNALAAESRAALGPTGFGNLREAEQSIPMPTPQFLPPPQLAAPGLSPVNLNPDPANREAKAIALFGPDAPALLKEAASLAAQNGIPPDQQQQHFDAAASGDANAQASIKRVLDFIRRQKQQPVYAPAYP